MGTNEPQKRAVIIGPYLLHNFGDDLIGLLLAQHLQRNNYSVSIPGLSAANAKWLGIDVATSTETALRDADLIVNGGGGTLGDTGVRPSEGHRKRLLKASLYGRLRRRHVITTAMGAGPLTRRRGILTTRAICALSSHVGVRDEESRATLEAIGVPSRKITTGADVALLADRLPFPRHRPTGKIGVQFDIAPYLNESNNGNEHKIQKELVRYVDAHDENIVLLRNSGRPSDLLQYTQKNVPGLNYTYMPDFLGGLTQPRCVITSHLHIAIAAYANRIPCFSLYVREKTARFYRQIDRPERAIPLSEATPDHLISFLREAETTHWDPKDEEKLTELKNQSTTLLHLLDWLCSI